MPTLLLLLLFFFLLKLEKMVLYAQKAARCMKSNVFLETTKHEGPSLKYISAGHKQIIQFHKNSQPICQKVK